MVSSAAISEQLTLSHCLLTLLGWNRVEYLPTIRVIWRRRSWQSSKGSKWPLNWLVWAFSTSYLAQKMSKWSAASDHFGNRVTDCSATSILGHRPRLTGSKGKVGVFYSLSRQGRTKMRTLIWVNQWIMETARYIQRHIVNPILFW